MNHQHRLRLLAIGVLAVGVMTARTLVAQQGPVARAALAARVDSLAQSFMANSGPSAMSIAVVHRNDTLVYKAWGLANRARNVAASVATPYHIASITKQFTSALVLRLAERSRISLSDSIGKYLSATPREWRGVTIAQLLNHTAGIPEDGDDEFRLGEPFSPETLISVKRLSDSLRFPAGSRWQYSNTGYDVLGMLIEKLYGASFATVVERELIKPLNLSHTSYCPAEPGANGQAVGYDRNGAEFVLAQYMHVSHEYAAGAICSTIGDLIAWNRALHGGRVVSAASYERMITPEGGAVKDRYGFGLRRTAFVGHDAIEHDGSTLGFVALNAWFPVDSLSITVLTNTHPIPGGRAFLVPDLVRVAFGLPVRIAPPAIAVRPAALLRYTGRYDIQLPNRQLGMQVIVEGDHLIAQADGQSPIPLWASSDNAFIAPSGAIRLTFVVESGAVTKFVLEQNGGKFDGVPVFPATIPPSLLERYPLAVQQAELKGAAHPSDASVASGDRRCIDGSRQETGVSGEFTAGPLSWYADNWRAGSVKIWWRPLHARGADTLVVHATRLDSLAVFDFRSTNLVSPVPADGKRFYATDMRLPSAGSWLMTASAGTNWGCFLLEIR